MKKADLNALEKTLAHLPVDLKQHLAGCRIKRVLPDSEQPFLDMEKRYPTLRNRVERLAGTRHCSLKQWTASTPAFDAEEFTLLEWPAAEP